jgi:hypothetical protein
MRKNKGEIVANGFDKFSAVRPSGLFDHIPMPRKYVAFALGAFEDGEPGIFDRENRDSIEISLVHDVAQGYAPFKGRSIGAL